MIRTKVGKWLPYRNTASLQCVQTLGPQLTLLKYGERRKRRVIPMPLKMCVRSTIQKKTPAVYLNTSLAPASWDWGGRWRITVHSTWWCLHTRTHTHTNPRNMHCARIVKRQIGIECFFLCEYLIVDSLACAVILSEYHTWSYVIVMEFGRTAFLCQCRDWSSEN